MRPRPRIQGLDIRRGAHLPHWTAPDAVYSVTFRLADSLPSHVLDRWTAERDEILHRLVEQGRTLTAHEHKRLAELFSQRVDAFLDAGSGACILRDDACAQIVADAIAFFDGQRYDLGAWCVMPNHVHVMLAPREERSLSDILHSWKSFSAKAINRLRGESGTLWQREYYDHIIRDDEDFAHHTQYILDNPIKAGLKNWKWLGAGKPLKVAQHCKL
jgi:REP element-mobilizing transposase RayT